MAALEIEPFRVDPVMPSRLSMSFIRAATGEEGCLRRAHHERISDSTGMDAIIGRVFHDIAGHVGWATVLQGERTPDYALVERITEQTLRVPEQYDPLGRHGLAEVRYLVGKWMLTAEFHPDEEFEVSSRQVIHGHTISARIDRRRIDKAENVAHVEDYKTGRADPPQRPEPTPQGDIYALNTLYEFPWLDGVWFAQRHVRFDFPPQPYFYDLDEIAEIDAWLGVEVARIAGEYAKGGKLPVNPGTACEKHGTCPVADGCPAKEWARPATVVRTADQALSEFAELLAEEGIVKDLRDRLRAWSERDALLAIIDSDDEALTTLAALVANEASIHKRKLKLRGHVARAGTRGVELNGQEISYGDPHKVTDWKAVALASHADPAVIEEHTKDRSPEFKRRRA